MNDSADLVPSAFNMNFTGWAWWNTTWNNKIQINITNWNCAGTYCMFPITFTTAYGNGSDWRFSDSTESSSLSYWYQDSNFSAGLGTVWINASNQTTMIYLYYNATGSPGNISSIDNTFLFGDDFNGASLNLSKWVNDGSGGTYTGNTSNGLFNISEATSGQASRWVMANNLTNGQITAIAVYNNSNPKVLNASNQVSTGWGVESPHQYMYSNFSAVWRGYDNTRKIGERACVGATDCVSTSAFPLNLSETWYLTYNNATTYVNVSFVLNNGTKYTNGYTALTNSLMQNRFFFEIWQDSGVLGWTQWDFIAVYPMALSTPTFTFGASQTQTGTNTCTYSSGNWTINLSDLCNITASQNLGANYLIFNGTGTCTFNGTSRIVISAKGEKWTNIAGTAKKIDLSSVWFNYTG